MNLQTVSTPFPILPSNSPKTVSIKNSAYGSFSVTKRVFNLQNNCGVNLVKPVSDSRFNLGYWNSGKRVYGPSFSLRNGGVLVRVRCGGLEKEDNEDAFYIRRCVELARQAIGWTSPNPMVGCVIVKDGKVVGEGFHPEAGQPHAEVFALRNAGELAENATAYVSLEPCNHYGKTPPCSEALIKAKVKKVVVGMVDPNPIVSSRGIDRLREAGIEVVVGVEEDLCKKLLEAFTHKMLSKKPFVTVRYSISVNGVLLDRLDEDAFKCGGYYSKLLQEYDAVIQPPSATTQEFSISPSHEPNAHQPLHIFIAKNPNSLIQIHNLPTEADCKAIIITDKEVVSEPKVSQLGIETVVMNRVSLDAILDYCNRQGFCNLLVDFRGDVDALKEILEEGHEMNLIQKVVAEVLPFWASSKESVSASAVTSLTQRKGMKNLSSTNSGNSILLEGYF